MAKKKFYVLVGIEVTNDNVSEITNEMIDDIVCEVDYQFNNVGDFKIETKITDTYNEYPKL